MAEDVSILQEIDDALRVDKAQEFWARNSAAIITVCALIILSTIVSEIWKNHQHTLHEQQTATFAQAESLAEDSKYGEALSLYIQVEQGGGQLATLAALRRAEALVHLKQEDKALAVYNTVALGQKDDAGETFRDYAAWQAYILSHNEALATGKAVAPTDGGKAAREPGRIFASAFAETDALRLENSKQAQALFNGIVSGRDAPFSQRVRVAALLDPLKDAPK